VTGGRWASLAEPPGPIIGNRNRADADGWAFEELARRCPFQELRDAVDLIVVTTVRKGEQLEQEAAGPFGFLRQVKMAGFDLEPPCGQPCCRPASGQWGGAYPAVCRAADPAGAPSQVWRPRSRRFRPGAAPQGSRSCAEGQGIGAEHERRRSGSSPSRPCARFHGEASRRAGCLSWARPGADRKVVGLARHHGDVPALHDEIAWTPWGGCS
jgi:hypothetical protein